MIRLSPYRVSRYATGGMDSTYIGTNLGQQKVLTRIFVLAPHLALGAVDYWYSTQTSLFDESSGHHITSTGVLERLHC